MGSLFVESGGLSGQAEQKNVCYIKYLRKFANVLEKKKNLNFSLQNGSALKSFKHYREKPFS